MHLKGVSQKHHRTKSFEVKRVTYSDQLSNSKSRCNLMPTHLHKPCRVLAN